MRRSAIRRSAAIDAMRMLPGFRPQHGVRCDRRRVMAVVGALAAGMLAIPAVASAGTLYVSHTGALGNKDMNCATAAHNSVQAAVNDARNGSKVYLCGSSPYVESVTVQDKNVDFAGDPGATLQSPSSSDDHVLAVLGKSMSHIDGLTIEGPNACGMAGGDTTIGIEIDGGAKAQVTNTHVTGAGCDFFAGIGAGLVGTGGSVDVKGGSVDTYEEFGVIVVGSASKIHVNGSTIDGGGQKDAFGRAGVFIGDGATGEVQQSSINNNETTTNNPVGVGVEVAGGCGGAPLTTHVQVHNNTLSNNDVGVALTNHPVDSACNGSSPAPPTKTENNVHDNTIVKNDGVTNTVPYDDQHGNHYNGYQVGISDEGNADMIQNNKISGDYGPTLTPLGPLKLPIDIQSQPTISPKVMGNTYNGAPTHPPY